MTAQRIASLHDDTTILDAAVRAARKGGRCIREAWERNHRVSFKKSRELVTETDYEAQRIIVNEIESAFPDHSILAEEEDFHVRRTEHEWIVDPLDGTVNFAHGFPFVGVSIAYKKGDEILVGVVYNPIMEELFWAERGRGAHFRNAPMRVSTEGSLSTSLVATGFPYDLWSVQEEVMTKFRLMALSSLGVRRPGSAALDLAYVARGVFDGFWEQDLKPWDIAAGILLVREAGGVVTDFRGGRVDLHRGEIMATNGLIHDQMIAQLRVEGEPH